MHTTCLQILFAVSWSMIKSGPNKLGSKRPLANDQWPKFLHGHARVLQYLSLGIMAFLCLIVVYVYVVHACTVYAYLSQARMVVDSLVLYLRMKKA